MTQHPSPSLATDGPSLAVRWGGGHVLSGLWLDLCDGVSPIILGLVIVAIAPSRTSAMVSVLPGGGLPVGPSAQPDIVTPVLMTSPQSQAAGSAPTVSTTLCHCPTPLLSRSAISQRTRRQTRLHGTAWQPLLIRPRPRRHRCQCRGETRSSPGRDPGQSRQRRRLLDALGRGYDRLLTAALASCAWMNRSGYAARRESCRGESTQ